MSFAADEKKWRYFFTKVGRDVYLFSTFEKIFQMVPSVGKDKGKIG